MKTITGTAGAWLSSTFIDRDPEEFSNLHITDSDMTECGWVRVGTASVTVDLLSDADKLTNHLALLNEAERRVKADAQSKLNEIEGQRQRLLAIEYKPCQTTEG